MDFDKPLFFEYIDCTGHFGYDQELFWKVTYANDKYLQIVTPVKGTSETIFVVDTSAKTFTEMYARGVDKQVHTGEPNLQYLEYLVAKGAKFVDWDNEIHAIFGSSVPKLVQFLTLPWVAKHEYREVKLQ